MSKGFNGLIEKVSTCGMKKVAVAVAQDAHVLEAVRAAKERKIAEIIKSNLEAIGITVNIEKVPFEQYKQKTNALDIVSMPSSCIALFRITPKKIECKWFK